MFVEGPILGSRITTPITVISAIPRRIAKMHRKRVKLDLEDGEERKKRVTEGKKHSNIGDKCKTSKEFLLLKKTTAINRR